MGPSARTLYALLYGGAPSKRDSTTGARHWPGRQTPVLTRPLVTVFGFIAQPRKHKFLKPMVTRRPAKRRPAKRCGCANERAPNRLPVSSLCMKADAATPGTRRLWGRPQPQKSHGIRTRPDHCASDHLIVRSLGAPAITIGRAVQAVATEDADHCASTDQAFSFKLMQGNGDARTLHAKEQARKS